MIVIDNSYQIGGKVYRRTVSDENRMIRKVGADEIYSEAVDVLTSQWTYEETDTPIEIETQDTPPEPSQ